MKNKFILRAVSLGILATVVLTTIGYPAYATLQDEKDALEVLEQEKQDVQDLIDGLEDDKSAIEANIRTLDAELTTISAELYSTQKKLAKVQKKIKKNKKKLKKAKKKIKKQYASMKLRIQFMYENGNQEMMSLFFESASISDFLNKAEYISQLSTYDRDMLDEMKETKATIEATQETLKEQEASLETLEAEQQAQVENVETLVAAKQTELAEYDAKIAESEDAMDELDNAIGDKQEVIKEMERIEAERKQNQQNNNNVIVSNPGYIWPLPGHSYISSGYGYRSDPFTGAQSYHSGIDLPAPSGTPIVAANSGQVAWSTYSYTAGNWIGIDHGNGVYTVYMHMSALLVSAGQYVNQGDTIGLVGTTGSSTGNHLHFSVRLNGNYTNPLSYVSP